MKLQEIISTVEGQVLVDSGVDQEISCAAASDRMSDVLAFAEPFSVLLTGLCNPQVVRTAEMADIAAVIFVHNHPSGDTRPSQEDILLTRRLVQAGDLLGIKVLDHVIVGDGGHYSFRDSGLLQHTA